MPLKHKTFKLSVSVKVYYTFLTPGGAMKKRNESLASKSKAYELLPN